jgi:hypothetical protein
MEVWIVAAGFVAPIVLVALKLRSFDAKVYADATLLGVTTAAVLGALMLIWSISTAGAARDKSLRAQVSDAEDRLLAIHCLSWDDLLREFRELTIHEAQIRSTKEGGVVNWNSVEVSPYSWESARRFDILAAAAGRKAAAEAGLVLSENPELFWYRTVGQPEVTVRGILVHTLWTNLLSRSIDACLQHFARVRP